MPLGNPRFRATASSSTSVSFYQKRIQFAKWALEPVTLTTARDFFTPKTAPLELLADRGTRLAGKSEKGDHTHPFVHGNVCCIIRNVSIRYTLYEYSKRRLRSRYTIQLMDDPVVLMSDASGSVIIKFQTGPKSRE